MQHDIEWHNACVLYRMQHDIEQHNANVVHAA